MISKNNESSKFDRRKKIFDFIENNGVKSEFVSWLNTQHQDAGFSEKDSWEEIRFGILNESKISEKELKNFAHSLGKKNDLKNLLENIEEKTEKAEEVAQKAFFLSTFRKLAVAVGGILFLTGLFFVVISAGFFLQIFKIDVETSLRLYLGGVTAVFGFFNILGGSLLVTR